MTTAPKIRCARCGSQVKADKRYCPSCGKDLQAPPPAPEPVAAPAAQEARGSVAIPGDPPPVQGKTTVMMAAEAGSGPAEPPPATPAAPARPPRAKNKLCAICMQSFADNDVQEVDGQILCNDCLAAMRAKKAKAGGEPDAAKEEEEDEEEEKDEKGEKKEKDPADKLKAVEIKKEPVSMGPPIVAGILILIVLVWIFWRLFAAKPPDDDKPATKKAGYHWVLPDGSASRNA